MSALSRAGHEVVRVVGALDGRSGQSLHCLAPRVAEGRALRLLGLSSKRLARGASQWMTQAKLDRFLAAFKPDVINVHNIHRWDPRIVDTCARHAPVAWTLHDMWSFTGRCAYAYECRRFVTGCDADCPTPQEYPALAPPQIEPAWKLRRSLYERLSELVVVTPSRWLAQEAAAGLFAEHAIRVIPYGVPTEIYAPLAPQVRQAFRQSIGVADDDILVTMVADNIADRRKGFEYAREALAAGHERVVVGMVGVAESAPDIPGVRVHRFGYVTSEAEMAKICGAADFLLHPAPVDNLPNVVLEALACGTPTVAFPIGGLPDMVRPGQTGWLASGTTSLELRQAIASAVASLKAGCSYRETCRSVAETDYTEPLQARRYEELFAEMIDAGRRRATRAGVRAS